MPSRCMKYHDDRQRNDRVFTYYSIFDHWSALSRLWLSLTRASGKHSSGTSCINRSMRMSGTVWNIHDAPRQRVLRASWDVRLRTRAQYATCAWRLETKGLVCARVSAKTGTKLRSQCNCKNLVSKSSITRSLKSNRERTLLSLNDETLRITRDKTKSWN